MSDIITLAHGNGGRQALELITKVFVKYFGMNGPLTDSAILEGSGLRLAFTTDSYVVDPVFFPGGDIGTLAVCGTVNDLSVSGAEPKYLSASFIIEEGFPMGSLEKIVASMAAEARKADVRIVTGDTKIVEKGKCDKLFITTAGIGSLDPKREHLSTGSKIVPGDRILINGSLGNHAIAILGARRQLSFNSPVISDCAPLNHLIKRVLEKCNQIRFMRDITRGGLAAVLNELMGMTGKDIIINESAVPVEEPVKGFCEMLGFDPLYLANEGKVLIVAGMEEAENVLKILRSDPLGKDSQIIGEVLPGRKGQVILQTSSGGKRILDMPSGMQLPRIC